MKIDTRSESVVYFQIGEWTYYIDNSTGEHIVQRWKTKEEGESNAELFDAKWEKEE